MLSVAFFIVMLNFIMLSVVAPLIGQTWVESSTIGVVVLIYATQLHSRQKQPNLKLITWPKQLLGSLPLDFALPGILLGLLFSV